MRVRRIVAELAVSLSAVGLAIVVLRALGVGSPMTVAVADLLIVLVAASSGHLVTALVTALVATLGLNFFFMPPIGTFEIADSENWMALGAFLLVAGLASQLSATAQARQQEAVERRHEVTRLFDVSRDVLLTTDREGIASIARHVARRFELPRVTVARLEEGAWLQFHGGAHESAVDTALLHQAWTAARQPIEFDARSRSYAGHTRGEADEGPVSLVPFRIGPTPVGLLVLGGRPIEPGTSDAIAGLVAIAVERARFLEDRRLAELTRQRADLSSSLLAALGHDLRTPLTAIRVAVTNAGDSAFDADTRASQTRLAVGEIDHLSRLLQEILDMARIETHAVTASPQWVTAGAIVDAAQALVGTALSRHGLRVDADEATELRLDPRLTSAALAHVLENAARYSPEGTAIDVRATAGEEGLRIVVTDQGPGLLEADLERLFEPFVRGRAGQRAGVGTGLGLAITRGLLSAAGGRIWAERPEPGRGAMFVIAVPAPARPVEADASWA